VALEVSSLSFWYGGEEQVVLHDVDLKVPRGQFLALVGANGSGKTTLVKHFNGLLRPGRGEVRVAGRRTANRSIGELARQVGYLAQHPEHQIFGATVREELSFGPRNLGLASAEVEARVQDALTRFGLADVAERPPAILSYGLRRRVTLASLATLDSPVLALDEPTVGLDALGRRETLDWMAEAHAQGRTILLVTHDMALAAARAERVIVLHQGRIIADGLPDELFQGTALMGRASLVPPPVVALSQALQPLGLQGTCLTVDAFCEAYSSLMDSRSTPQPGQVDDVRPARPALDEHDPAL
jgi:energy-coupling factor transport system ATP-binding protein